MVELSPGVRGMYLNSEVVSSSSVTTVSSRKATPLNVPAKSLVYPLVLVIPFDNTDVTTTPAPDQRATTGKQAFFSLHDASVLAWRVTISELPMPSTDYFLLLFSLQNVELGSRLC